MASSSHNNSKKDRSHSIDESNEEMYVTKRDGKREIVSFDKILNRIKKLGNEGNMKLNYTNLVMKVIDQLYDGIPTMKIDELSAEQCASMASIHPDYSILAGYIIVSNHHKNTSSSFKKVMTQLYSFKDKNGEPSPLIADETYQIVKKHAVVFEKMCDYKRDYLIDYFGFKTLERAYLMKINKKTVERIQHMWLRVSIGIHGDNLEKIQETYDLMSQKYFTHATPTLFNSGTPRPQLSSCFLLAMENDSIEGIYNTLKDCAMISKWAGGIGLHIHNVRASGSHIRGTNGSSNGIVPMLKVFNHTAKYVDQCLDPETIVYTKRGAIPIKNIVIGDEVVTDDGNFYEIGKVLDNDYKGDMYTLDIENQSTSLKLTDMHPLWTIPMKGETMEINSIKQELNKNLLVPDFIEVKNIQKGDFIGFPIPQYEKDILQYTEEDCRMYGILLSRNCLRLDNERYDEKRPTIIFDCNSNKETIQFVENYLKNLNIPILYDEIGDEVRISWSRTNLFKFTEEMYYDINRNKYMLPNMLHLPKNKILQFIKGVIEIDQIRETNDNIIIRDNTQNVVESIRYILLRLGVLTECENKMKRISNELIIGDNLWSLGLTIDTFNLRIPKHPILFDLFPEKNWKSSYNFFEYNGYLFSSVKNVTFEPDYSGRVIDIEVDNDDHHNFLTHNGLVKNGGGKRNGSFAIYLEPWHADVEMFLQMRKNHGDEELKARDLFYALWIPDLFMERVKVDGPWTLMCPDECPGLSDVYGDAFNELYTKYEQEGKGRTTMKARDLWFQVLDAQMETGTPYLLYKDAVNKKSNQKNIGTIKSSNLCCEINQVSDANHTAVCNLASLALPSYVNTSDPNNIYFDYEKLHEVTKVVTYNLNRIIDINFYPIEKAKRSNMRDRPIGIGVQGLADVFMMMNLPFTSEEAKRINHNIFETMYHAALEKSYEMAIEHGPYETFPGSPASEGILQFDMWNKSPTWPDDTPRYDWEDMKQKVKTHGIRNSLLLAPMPTASTSQILGNNECFEPITSNIYNRRTIAGEFILANKYLMKDLIALDLWNEKIKNNIIANNGSVQQIDIIPEHIREKYKTVWEIPMKSLIDMAADRGCFCCQSQSLNLFISEPTYANLTAMHFYSHKAGLKTGIYYLRRRARHSVQKFTIEPEKKEIDNDHTFEEEDEHEICESCSA